jgi:hypothetical protein
MMAILGLSVIENKMLENVPTVFVLCSQAYYAFMDFIFIPCSAQVPQFLDFMCDRPVRDLLPVVSGLGKYPKSAISTRTPKSYPQADALYSKERRRIPV